MKDPDQLQVEIAMQHIILTDKRMLEVYITEQSMLAFPVAGYITSEQARIIAGWLDLEDSNPQEIEFPVEQNPEFKLVVKGHNPGTDRPETREYLEQHSEGDDVFVPPVIGENGLPQDTPSVIKPAVPEDAQEGDIVFDGENHVVVTENKKDENDATVSQES
jgi:hypothetical protein